MMILRWESSSGNYRTPSSCPSCAQFLAAAKTISFFLAFFWGREYCYAIAMQLCKAIFRWLCVAEHVCFRCPLPLVPSAMC